MPTPLRSKPASSQPNQKRSDTSKLTNNPFISEKDITLRAAIDHHIERERISFHTPGHKGKQIFANSETASNYLSFDLTELPGLDDLSYPTSVLKDLEKRAALLWGAASSLLSVNGASACLIAALLTLGQRGSQIILPRNCHRSVINALVLSGLEPIWFDPIWEESWGIWGAATTKAIATLLEGRELSNLAGVLLVSPTYAGAISDVKEIASLCHRHNLPLLVDEAHGAHLFATTEMSALHCGADLVAHSLHKTLPGLTQTGVLHLSTHGQSKFAITERQLRNALNLVQSTSPSYLFLASIDKLLSDIETGSGLSQINELQKLGKSFRQRLEKFKSIEFYAPVNGSVDSHILLKCPEPKRLADFLKKQGIFPEHLLDLGLLLLLGIGTSSEDIDYLVKALEEFEESAKGASSTFSSPCLKPQPLEQVFTPRQAFYMPSHSLATKEAVGQIAAECLAPCPPGWPITVPGQRISSDLLRWHNFQSINVVVSN